jgi:acyl-CoA dehydrogenase
LMKLIVPTEQALSMAMLAAWCMDEAIAGGSEARDAVRILTPLLKFRACRDNIPVATGSMEVRGGNGYIEEWVQARLVRDAHVGVLWEGTSNINAIDIVARAVGKNGAHKALSALVTKRLDAAQTLPGSFRGRLAETFAAAVAFAERVAAEPAAEPSARRAASALYHATSAVLLACEGAQPGVDPRRALLARFVLDHRLAHRDPFAPDDDVFERAAIDLVLGDGGVAPADAMRLLQG